MTSVEVMAFLLKRMDGLLAREVIIDDMFFRLHHLWTCPVLFMFVFVSILYRLLDPISCMATSNGLSEKMLNAYCLMQNTFVLPDKVAKNIGQDISHQGVDMLEAGEPKSYQKYYQWVPLILIVQAILFYASRYFWVEKEKGITAHLLLNLDEQIVKSDWRRLMPEKEVDERVGSLASFLDRTRGRYGSYFRFYLACTVANLLNVCLQIVFMDLFLGASFFENGWRTVDVWNVDYNNRTDPLVAIFPRVAKCQFNQFGVAGDVQKHDILCVLPFNFFYEMIFVVNLIWFTLLAVISFVAVVFWTVNRFSLRARVHSLRFWKPFSDVESLKKLLRKRDVGDWFVLRLLANNMSDNHFATLLEELAVGDGDETFEPLISNTSKKGND